MEEGTLDQRTERYSKIIKGSWCSQFRYGSNPWMARYVYGFLFLIASLMAWGIRDYGQIGLTVFKRLNGCEGGVNCMGTEGVLRVSLGCFLFYSAMFFSTIGTSKLYEAKESWHSGWWSVKLLLMIGFTVIPFLVPSKVIQIYGQISHFGAGVFLVIQLISIISFITWLNDCCQSEKYAERCHIQVMLLATTAYIICIFGIILMYIWYAPDSSCMLNIFFISWTFVLLQLMTSVSLHQKVNAGFLTPGFMGLYVVFLCWSAIRSEPPEEKCLIKSAAVKRKDWLTIISFVVGVLAMVIATFSTGIDSKCFQFRKKDTESEDDKVPYGFGFFHFVFATGAMYFAMLLIGWNAEHPMQRWTLDIGWTSTWVRIINEWLAVCLYIWMLLAPFIWKNRQPDDLV
ncbi:probable serine incorporator isoform X1 [Impatiens glandulifera]|uniref:probable serine incorporator isoform X1 n=2 Tax=Impatiens glandulifera TaxID=253017 RepID=UPI001FB055B6|nr:probable serine incorporator isoform X1 [Impatiens glandulifera]